jgi:hypothetical protein
VHRWVEEEGNDAIRLGVKRQRRVCALTYAAACGCLTPRSPSSFGATTAGTTASYARGGVMASDGLGLSVMPNQPDCAGSNGSRPSACGRLAHDRQLMS